MKTHSQNPPPERTGNQYLKHFLVRGTQYYDLLKAWDQLRIGQELTLKPEPDNPFDHHAIQIWHGEHMLGYVPRSENRHMSKLLNAGWQPYEVLVQSLYADRPIVERLEVCVRVVNNR